MANILAEKAVLAALQVSYWGNRRLDRKVTEEIHEAHDAARDSGRYHKRLVAGKALKKIYGLMGEARAFHYRCTQPWLDGGTRVLPTALYLDYAKELQRIRQEYEGAVAEFIEAYPALVDQAKIELNGMFNQDDYPSQKQMKSYFGFSVSILPCPDAEDFRISIGKEHLADIQRDVESRLVKVVDGTLRDSAERIVDAVGHMAERLKAYKPAMEKGDKTEGAFRDSLVGHVRDLAELLPAFNLTGDPRLAKITERIKKQLCEYDADTLRENDGAREKVAKAADKILKDVSVFFA